MAISLSAVAPATAADISVKATAPTFSDTNGSTNDYYDVPTITGVEYLVDGVVVDDRTSHRASGTVLITSRAKPGYVLSSTSESSWSHMFTQAAPNVMATMAVPEAPAFSDMDGTDRDTYIIRAKEGVEYLVDGEVKAAGSHPASGTVLITSRAKPGYYLAGTTSWSRIFSTAVPEIMAVPEAPAFSDMDGTDRDTYIIRAKEGVEYLVDGEVKAAGSHPASGTVLITSRAKPGYYLAGTTSWSRIFSTAVLAIPVTPAAPVFTDQYGTAKDTYTLPTKYGVEYYYVNGVATAAGTYPASGTVTVTAKARTGYTLVGTVTWSHTFTTDSVIWVLPQAVYFDDEDGTANDTYTIPTKTGVEYTVGGAVKPAGTYPASGTVTVVAQAKPGFALSGIILFKHAFSSAAPVTAVNPNPVTFIDQDGTAKDSYTIPATTGVEYLVNGTAKSAGTYPAAGTMEVTAKAKTDYVLADGVATSWKTTFSDQVAEHAPENQSPFTDVSTDHVFYEHISWMAAQGISTGWDQGDGTAVFKPHAPVLRDQMAAFLYRSAGSPEYTPPAVSPFTDVSTKHTFYKEIAWLAHSGISTGWVRGDGTAVYKPATPVLRDQMAAFLYRLAGEPAYDAPATSPFADLNTGQGFYKEMAWLADNEISKGWTLNENTAVYRPGNQILRDQMAAFLYRLDRLL